MVCATGSIRSLYHVKPEALSDVIKLTFCCVKDRFSEIAIDLTPQQVKFNDCLRYSLVEVIRYQELPTISLGEQDLFFFDVLQGRSKAIKKLFQSIKLLSQILPLQPVLKTSFSFDAVELFLQAIEGNGPSFQRLQDLFCFFFQDSLSPYLKDINNIIKYLLREKTALSIIDLLVKYDMICTDLDSGDKSKIQSSKYLIKAFSMITQLEAILHSISAQVEYFPVIFDAISAVQKPLYRVTSHIGFKMNKIIKAFLDSYEIKPIRFLIDQGILPYGANLLELIERVLDLKDYEMMKMLLSKSLVYPDFFFTSISAAVEGEDLKMLKLLLSDDRDLDPTYLSCMVMISAQKGNCEILSFLLQEPRTISKEQLGNALTSAAHKGKWSSVITLISDNREVDEVSLSFVIDLAYDECLFDVVYSLIFCKTEISIERRGHFLIRFAEDGNLPLTIALLSLGAIRLFDHNLAIRLASGEHKEEIIGAILNAELVDGPQMLYQTHSTAEESEEGVWFITFEEVKENPLHYLNLLFEQGLPKKYL